MSASNSLLQPGQIIRPQLTLDDAKILVEEIWGLKVVKIVEQNSYDDRNYRIKVADTWDNPEIHSLWPHGYVLKVLNSMDSPKQHTVAEHAAEHVLEAAGLTCPIPVPDKQGNLQSLRDINQMFNNNENTTNDGSCAGKNLVRLMRFVPGRIMHEVVYTTSLLQQVGIYTGNIHQALQNFDHPALRDHKTIWGLSSLPDLAEFAYVVTSTEHKRVVDEVIRAFIDEVVPQYPHFKQGVIHGDINEQNIIVHEKAGQESMPEASRVYDVHGILDFGDMQFSYNVFDVAISIMYMSVESSVVDPLDVGGHVLAGYLAKHELNHQEWNALKICVAGRYCQSLVMGLYTLSVDPGNDYVVTTGLKGWDQLVKLWQTPTDVLYKRWRDIIKSYTSTTS